MENYGNTVFRTLLDRVVSITKMWVRSGMTLGTKWYDLGTKWYGLGYEMVWDESAWVRNDLIP